jgi:predicted RNA-binding Zn-ribbon protein involved in translation (DUF1610 family)
MEVATSAAERMLLEAEFRARRGRVLRAEGHVVLAAAIGLGAVVVARQAAPAAFEPATAFFVLATLGSLLRVWWVANRHWRCPACEVRWETKETLASFAWNHCPSCGAPLRAYPVQREQERAALAEFALDPRSPGELLDLFERRRRRGLWAAAVAMAAAAVALVWMAGHDLGDTIVQSVMAGFGALVAGAMLWAARCPRCRSGIIGQGRHCQRCGLRLAEIGDPADPRTGG